jgi:RNA polymerase sigma-54 factor
MLDLQQEIQDALESNLMLENADEAERPNGEDPDGGARERAQAEADLEREVQPENMPMPQELPVDAEWSDHYDSYVPTSGGGDEGADFDLFAHKSASPTLNDHLQWQLNLSRMEGNDLAIATALIESINADGYLTVDPQELLEALDDEELTLEEVEAVLHRVQSLDPAGVGARNLRECLLIQLRQLSPEQYPLRDLAIAVCERHVEALSKNDLEPIRRDLGISTAVLGEVIALIRTLHPRPGALIAESQPEYVIPDVFVRKHGGAWTVELNPETTPKLRVNPDYSRLIRRADQSEDNTFLKNHLQEARWFIKSLASRNDTIVRVAAKIVEL